MGGAKRTTPMLLWCSTNDCRTADVFALERNADAMALAARLVMPVVERSIYIKTKRKEVFHLGKAPWMVFNGNSKRDAALVLEPEHINNDQGGHGARA